MKKSLVTVAALAAFAAPAHATGSATCRGTINPQLQLDLVIGRMAGSVIAQAQLSDGSRLYRTGEAAAIAQAWLDERAMHLDLTDANGTNYLARLRTWKAAGRNEYSGSLRYDGRQYQVRCRLE